MWGAGLPAPLGQPRVPKGGGASRSEAGPRDSLGVCLLHTGNFRNSTSFACLRPCKMTGQGVCELPQSPATVLGCIQAPIRPVAGPRVQGKKQLPCFSAPFRPSRLKSQLPSPFLPAKPQF